MFFCIRLASIFFSSAIYMASDLFTVLRWIHVFYEDVVDAVLQWSDTKWFIISAINLLLTSFMSSMVAFYDLVPDFMNRNRSYDPMLVFWSKPDKHITYFIQPSLPIGQIVYTLFAVGLTTVVHKKILYHLTDKFVNLAGITDHIRSVDSCFEIFCCIRSKFCDFLRREIF